VGSLVASIFRVEDRRVLHTVGYARTNILGSRTSFIIASVAYIEIHAFRDNLFSPIA